MVAAPSSAEKTYDLSHYLKVCVCVFVYATYPLTRLLRICISLSLPL
jgi:hypothetical protein